MHSVRQTNSNDRHQPGSRVIKMANSTLPARICKISSGFSYVMLISTLIGFTALGMSSNSTVPWQMLAVKIVPLVIFIPGLLQGSDRTHAWLCFVVLVYFTMGILELFSLNNRMEGLFITLFSTLLFISSTLYIRWHKPEPLT